MSSKGACCCRPRPSGATRPITGAAKKSLFDILAPVLPEAAVVDLYCGTGTLGLEALSRGAVRCCVRRLRPPRAGAPAAEHRRRWASQDRCTVWSGDIPARLAGWLETLPGPVDLAFVDPPYADARRWSWPQVTDSLFAPLAGRLAEGGLVVLRVPAALEVPPRLGVLAVRRTQRYGDMAVVLLASRGTVRRREPMGQAPYTYFQPDRVGKFASLSLLARAAVEGFISGLHRSPHRGFSVEFTEHREYIPGDDLRHLDWVAWGRSDRYYVKQYEQETNLRAHILLDASSSMDYRHDAPGHQVRLRLLPGGLPELPDGPPAGRGGHDGVRRDGSASTCRPARRPRTWTASSAAWRRLSPGGRTALAPTFHELARRMAKRGLVLIISDLYEDADEVFRALQHLVYKKHQIILFHLLDEAELDLPVPRRGDAGGHGDRPAPPGGQPHRPRRLPPRDAGVPRPLPPRLRRAADRVRPGHDRHAL